MVLIASAVVAASDDDAAERGKTAITTKSYNPAIWSRDNYDKVWKQLGRRRDQARRLRSCISGNLRFTPGSVPE